MAQGTAGQEVPKVHLGYRMVPDCIPVFAKYLLEATNGGLEAQLLEGAASATTVEDLDTLVSKLDSAIHASLQAAGMPELQHRVRATQQRPKTRGAGANTQLHRRKKTVVQRADWETVQRLNSELLAL